MTRDPRLTRYFGLLVLVLAASLPLYRKWVSVAAPLAIVVWFFLPALPARLRALRRHGPTLAVLAFVALNLVSLLWSSHPDEGLDALSKYRYLLLVPVVATGLGRTSRHRVVDAFLAGATVATGLTWLALAGLISLGGASPDNPAVTMSHLDLSMILAVAALLALDRGLASTSPRTRVLWAAATFWLASGLVANLGRSGQLAFATGATVLVAVSVAGRSRRAAAIAVLALWALGVGLVLALPRVGDRLLEAGDEIRAAAVAGDFQSNQGRRLAAAIVASEMVRERPLVGFGIGGAMPRFRALLEEKHPDLAELVRWFPHLHNQYLQVAAELGALGLVILAVMLWQIGRLRGPGSATPNLGLLVAVAYVVGFLGDPYLHKQIPLAAFALLAGLATSAPEPDAPPE